MLVQRLGVQANASKAAYSTCPLAHLSVPVKDMLRFQPNVLPTEDAGCQQRLNVQDATSKAVAYDEQQDEGEPVAEGPPTHSAAQESHEPQEVLNQAAPDGQKPGLKLFVHEKKRKHHLVLTVQ